MAESLSHGRLRRHPDRLPVRMESLDALAGRNDPLGSRRRMLAACPRAPNRQAGHRTPRRGFYRFGETRDQSQRPAIVSAAPFAACFSGIVRCELGRPVRSRTRVDRLCGHLPADGDRPAQPAPLPEQSAATLRFTPAVSGRGDFFGRVNPKRKNDQGPAIRKKTGKFGERYRQPLFLLYLCSYRASESILNL